jgi:hypothetical protein
MCAHKNGVEEARHEADAEQPNARQADRPSRDDGGGHDIPGREIPPDASDRRGKIEEVCDLA